MFGSRTFSEWSPRRHGAVWVIGLLAVVAAVPAALPVLAADVTPPAQVTGLILDKDLDDVILSWNAVTGDAAGNPETVNVYRVYRGTTPDFVPDKAGGLNRIGETADTSFSDVGAVSNGVDAYYLVSAVDTAGNEGRTKEPAITTPPVLSGYWTDTSIELNWTDAEPQSEVDHYRVYYGPASHQYEFVEDAGLATSYSLTGLDTNMNWYSAVVAVDLNGNESDYSNEHVDVVGGTIDVRANDESELCWIHGDVDCPPKGNEVGRAGGWEKLVPVDFPEGDWTSVTLTFTMESRLCEGTPEAPDRCGDTNPTGWNPCGDPWDRGAHVFLVLDDCIDSGAGCMNPNNIELLNAITPFGTDAPPPDGSGRVPPRVLTFDITPFANLMAGQRRYIGAHIGSYAYRGWWVTTDFHFSKRSEEASPKPPAAGVVPLFFGGATPPTATVTIPPEATRVITRLFTTGHGGSSYCDGGANDGNSCTGNSDCPGGSCQNCDEFCHRTNRILVDGSPDWETVPWRNCCWPRGSVFCEGCQSWNSCGYPSCTFNRAGWCPGEIACHYNIDDGCDQDLDMTPYFPPGTHDVDYQIEPLNGSWSVSLVLYWYTD